MNKNSMEVSDEDFGFSAVSVDELKASDESLTALQTEVEIKREALQELYDMVMPLMKNLAKDSAKEYLHWPDRAVKMTAFIKKIDDFMKSS